jgi:hypothetical protein
LAPGFKKGKKPNGIDKSEDIGEYHVKEWISKKVYLNRYLHYIQLINKSSSGNKNVCNSGSDNSTVTVTAAAAAAFIVIIVIGHSNTYLLFQV